MQRGWIRAAARPGEPLATFFRKSGNHPEAASSMVRVREIEPLEGDALTRLFAEHGMKIVGPPLEVR
jgi:hypothetical protein